MMQLLRGFDSAAEYRNGFVAIGNFDGVHRGHQRMIARLVDRANEHEAPSVVFTFDPHPIQLLAPERMPQRLSTLEHRIQLLENCRVDFVVLYPTDSDFLAMSPRQFFDSIVRTELDAQGLVEGPNFCFGKDRGGDVALLRQLCDASGLHLDVVDPELTHDGLVSSSAIRAAISHGDMDSAVEMLGHPYRLTGVVVAGARRGRTIGFPTANLEGVEAQIPGDGVYAGRVELGRRVFSTAMNIGPNPTFGDDARKLEVHLIDFDGDLYGQTLNVDVVGRIRSTRLFDNADSLVKQLEADVEAVREVVRGYWNSAAGQDLFGRRRFGLGSS